MRPRRSNQQPHRPQMGSCSRRNRVPSLRRWIIHQQCHIRHLVYAVRLGALRHLCRFLLGSRSGHHHRIPFAQRSGILPRCLADCQSCRSDRGRCHQPGIERKQVDCGIRRVSSLITWIVKRLTIRSATYIVFIVIMCLGLPIALLLSPAEKGESGPGW